VLIRGKDLPQNLFYISLTSNLCNIIEVIQFFLNQEKLRCHKKILSCSTTFESFYTSFIFTFSINSQIRSFPYNFPVIFPSTGKPERISWSYHYLTVFYLTIEYQNPFWIVDTILLSSLLTGKLLKWNLHLLGHVIKAISESWIRLYFLKKTFDLRSDW